MKGGKGPLPRFIPGIPTPDYDSTPDRSPFSHRYLILYFSVNASRKVRDLQCPTKFVPARSYPCTVLGSVPPHDLYFNSSSKAKDGNVEFVHSQYSCIPTSQVST